MKRYIKMLLAVLITFTSQQAMAGNGNIPLPTSKFSVASTGSFAVCLNSSFTAEVACNRAGAVAVRLTYIAVGHLTQGKRTSCLSQVNTISNFPVDKSPPMVTNENAVIQISNYDPYTGTGDDNFTGYVGGQCNGTSFDNTNATQVSSGTAHFTISEQGKRIDRIITSLQFPQNSIGDFSLYFIERAQ